MKFRTLWMLSLVALPALAAPKKAAGIRDAKYALCAGQGTELFVDFTQSNLKKDNYGSTVGNLGIVKIGHRKTPATTPFELLEIKYPALISNGPATTIGVYDGKAKLNASVKTYDFETGKGEIKIANDTRVLDCEFYVGPVY